MTKLLNSFTHIFATLKTNRILKAYVKADPEKQVEFHRAEIKRIGQNKYDVQAYLRLSLMKHDKRSASFLSLKALGVSAQNAANLLDKLDTQHPKVSRFV